jgi:thiol-disulfide isomerase/thioredoxin
VSKSTLLIAAGLIAAVATGWGVARYVGSLDNAATHTHADGLVHAGDGHADGPLTLRLLTDPRPVPSFTVQDLDGRKISSESWRGKVTIVNFWATWCPPCRAEIPDLVELQDKYRDQLQIIGISQDETGPDVVRKFAAEHAVNYPMVMSTPELEQIFSGVYALPTTFIIDRDLQVVQKHVGMLNPVRTEAETRLLAGLDVDATVEYVEDETQALIKDAAQATSIPGVDLDSLTPEARTEVLARLNSETCTCGCGLTLAACRINDPTCSISLPLAQKIAAAYR